MRLVQGAICAPCGYSFGLARDTVGHAVRRCVEEKALHSGGGAVVLCCPAVWKATAAVAATYFTRPSDAAPGGGSARPHPSLRECLRILS
mgnify:CR=1 FL=1